MSKKRQTKNTIVDMKNVISKFIDCEKFLVDGWDNVAPEVKNTKLGIIPIGSELELLEVCWVNGFEPPLVEIKYGREDLFGNVVSESVIRLGIGEVASLVALLLKACEMASDYLINREVKK